MPLTVGADGLARWETPRRRAYPWKGSVVNPKAPEPAPPGPWVGSDRCLVCGARYQAFRSGSFEEAAHRLRAAAKADGDAGGGFRSRRAVLWWRRVIKLEAWYLEHYMCGADWDRKAGRPVPLEDRTLERRRLPELVELAAGDDPPTEVYARGHYFEGDELEPLVLEAARLYAEDLADWRWESWAPRWKIGRLAWARWGFPPADVEDRDTVGRWLHVRDTPQRGAFPVTVLVDAAELEDRRRTREAMAARAAELEAAIRAWLPEAVELEGHGYPLDGGHVRFRLPGLVGRLHWDPRDPGVVTVERQDLAAWATLYQGRPGRPTDPNAPPSR